MNWEEQEKKLLISYEWGDDSETVKKRIEHAWYMMYQQGNHPELKERSLSSCISMFYKLCRNNIKHLKYLRTN